MTRPPEQPIFAEPWQAQIFALIAALEKAGHFAWPRFQALLTAAIAAAPQDEQEAAYYYRHWLHAAETLLGELQLVEADELRARRTQLATMRAASHHHHN